MKVALKCFNFGLKLSYSLSILDVKLLHYGNALRVELVVGLRAAVENHTNFVAVSADNFALHKAKARSENGVDRTR